MYLPTLRYSTLNVLSTLCARWHTPSDGIPLVGALFHNFPIFPDFLQLFQVFVGCNVALEIRPEVRRYTPIKYEQLAFSLEGP